MITIKEWENWGVYYDFTLDKFFVMAINSLDSKQFEDIEDAIAYAKQKARIIPKWRGSIKRFLATHVNLQGVRMARAKNL